MEKKCKKAKWLSEEALPKAVTRREAKSKAKEKGKIYPSECRKHMYTCGGNTIM